MKESCIVDLLIPWRNSD